MAMGMKPFGGQQQKLWVLLVAAIGLQWVGALAAPGSRGDQHNSSLHWKYELQRVQAHSRMENTMYASTPDRADMTVMCPALSDGRLGPPIAVDVRGA